MKKRLGFWRWTAVFAGMGLLVPAVLTVWWHFAPYGAGPEWVLWPSSIMFMALDVPSPASTSTVVVVYAAAFVENCVLYAVIGALFWPIVVAVSRYRDRNRGLVK